MRLLFVVHRYGPVLAGGAEALTRGLARRLVERGHDVEVLTSRARSYRDWADVEPAGTSDDDRVTIHRLSVPVPRDVERFAELSRRVLSGRFSAPLHVQRAWLAAQGPAMPELEPWLDEHVDRFDAAAFVTYLYAPTVDGLAAVAGRVPTVVHPTAHDEPTLALDVVRPTFHLADGFACNTIEEAELVRDRFAATQPIVVTGVGLDPVPVPEHDEIVRFRAAYGLGDDPYLVCVGRIDPSKGTPELVEWFGHLRARRERGLRLVLVGDGPVPVGAPDGLVACGLVGEDVKRAAIAGSVALVQPSYFESFSIVLTEAWALGRPVIVQGRCPVLVGQVRRSAGGVAYRGLAELEAAVELLLGDPDLGARLARSGAAYTAAHYQWPTVLDRYEHLLDRVVSGRHGRRGPAD